ncbi:tetratricopeptide repeat protein, partial [Streptomyces spectabilis]
MRKPGKRRAVPGADPPRVAVNHTGDAVATAGATAVTGHRGPAPPRADDDTRHIAVRVSGSGPAIATAPGAFAVSGQMTIVRAPREPAPWPHQVGVVPGRAHCFRDRAEARRLRAAMEGGGTAVLSQVLAGMGGVGKTQLAAEHARTALQDSEVDVLVWVTARDRISVVAGLAQAGRELCRAEQEDPLHAALAFLAWLAPKANALPCRWLVVLDDVADPDDLHGLWPPTSPHGQTLITTRRRDAALTGHGLHLIDVGLFSATEAQDYLADSLTAHGRTSPADQLTALAGDLGRLPLALAQAAAYLADSGATVPAYRALLADRATTLADLAPDRLPDDQDLALAAAWSLSIDRADTLRPAGLARPMLHLAAMLDPNGIPHTVLTSRPALAHLAAHRTNAQTPADTAEEPAPVLPGDAVRALRALHRLSLVDHDPDHSHQAVRIHQLIQRATRDTLSPAGYGRIALAAADALAAAWSDIERDTALAQALRANTAALTACAEDALFEPDAHAVLYRAGRSLGEAGQAAGARDHFERLAAATRHHLGGDHHHTLAARHELARWRGDAGDLAGAAAALAELLPDRQRVLGDDHHGTLATRHELAYWRGVAGDPAGAAAALAELLPDRQRVLGNDHHDTLATRHNLASFRGVAGDPAGAAAALAELLPDVRRILGDDHPDTLATRHYLA